MNTLDKIVIIAFVIEVLLLLYSLYHYHKEHKG